MPNWSQKDVERATKRNPGLTVKGAELPIRPEHKGSEIQEGVINDSVCPKLERHASPRRVGKAKAEVEDSGRFFVRVTRVGKLLDEDNICEKICVDLCRYSGCLPDDRPGKTKIKAAQRTPEEGEEDHTLIEVFRLNDPVTEVSKET